MRWFDRLVSAESFMQLVDRLLKWAPLVIGTGFFSLLAGWATSATAAFNVYSPASWVFGGLVGACLFLIVYALWNYAALQAARRKFTREFVLLPHAVNPLDSVFMNRRIDINVFRPLLIEPVKGKTFVDCELNGPAVILLAHNISINGFELVNCELVQVKDTAQVHNPIIFEGLTITRGKLRAMTIFVPQSRASAFAVGGQEALWITP